MAQTDPGSQEPSPVLDRPAAGVSAEPRPPDPGPPSAGPRWAAAATVLVLLLLAGRYGYHRDELYFLQAGRHPAWGYPDQGPLTPLLARLADLVAPGNLYALRTPSAFIAGGCVLLVAGIARELGGGRAAQTAAAFLTATSAIVLAAGHLLSTTTADVLVWLVVLRWTVRVLRTGDTRWAPAVGAVLGVGLLNKDLPLLLGAGLVIGVAWAGPRTLLTDRRVLIGAALALLIAAPNLVWQAEHGFPQLRMASAISGGGSSYGGRLTGLLLQLVIVSPFALPVWVAGLRALERRPEWRRYRALSRTAVVVYAMVLATGGKGYYDAPLLLALTAAGSAAVRWGAPGARRWWLGAGAVAALVSAAVISLPVIPADRLPGFVVVVNYDDGETIGWPAFTDSIAAVYRSLPAQERDRAVILTGNYGEAGALARYGPAEGLPRAYSGHNGMADFGRPPDGTDVVIAVGWDHPDQLRQWFADVRDAGRVDERIDVDNDENHGPIRVCRHPLRPWPELWQQMRHLG
ncbi:ArnT family glycosyltransferase [Streptacidiphilus griseoplanus]|uniref:ArnT family glycosyltransferase n=1 Tax=Peterkaempfera griseoplana TaxID=66896 RepID=UPI001C37A604|nr:glycosyltransferase family 39 protein [Peterkaempfera griseoplana]